MKYLITYSLIFIFLILPYEPVFAEESTPSAQAIQESPTPTMAASPIPTLVATPSATIQPTTEPTILPLSSRTSPDSAKLRKPLKVLPLKRRTYRSSERIEIRYLNKPQISPTLHLTHANGKDLPMIVTESKNPENADETILMIDHPSQFTPGKYTMTITDDQGGTTTQDFNWGVLALNFNKSVYMSGETASIDIAVLDDRGDMVCTADLTLDITLPTGEVRHLDTADASIKRNIPICISHSATIEPDYHANFPVDMIGTYTLLLKAITKNGTYTTSDTFQAKNDAPFQIERNSATRIFPPHTYPMTLRITANQDFEGTISEAIPGGFEIIPSTDQTYLSPDTISTSSAIPVGTTILGASDTRIRYPFDTSYPITQYFGEQIDDEELQSEYIKGGYIGHDGIDFALPLGTPIIAVDDGEIIHVGYGPYGRTIIIQHSWGKSYYGHLDTFESSMDQSIKRGDIIGYSGNTGFSTGPHLHFAIRPNDISVDNGYGGAIDPITYLSQSTIGQVQGIQTDLRITTLAWNLRIKKGESVTLAYLYRAPRISPQFYLLGPLQFYQHALQSPISISNDLKTYRMVFSESRQWQLAADADVLVDGTVQSSNTHHQHMGSNVVFINDQIGYVFYNDAGTNNPGVYSKTLDGGVTWSAPVTWFDKASGNGEHVNVWYDQWTPGDDNGTNIYLAISNGGDDDIYFNRLDTRTDTLLAGTSGVDVSTDKINSLSSTGEMFSITKGTDGVLYIPVSDTVSAGEESYVKQCAAACDTPGNWTDAGTNPFNNPSASDQEIMLPLTNGDMLLILMDSSADDFLSKKFTRSTATWDAGWTNIDIAASDNSTYDSHWGATLDKRTGYIYLAYIADVATLGGSDDDIRTALYNGSWTSKTSVITNDGSRGLTSTKISVDELTGDIYVFYTAQATPGTITTADVYWKKSTDGMTTWSSEQGPINTTQQDLWGLSPGLMFSERLYTTWVDATNADLYGITILDTSLLNSQMRHGKWFNLGRPHATIF